MIYEIKCSFNLRTHTQAPTKMLVEVSESANENYDAALAIFWKGIHRFMVDKQINVKQVVSITIVSINKMGIPFNRAELRKT